MRQTLPIFSLVLALGLAACDKPPASTSKSSGPIAVDAHTVAKRSFADETLAIGTLRSEEAIEVSPSVTERIESLHFDDGEFVKAGQLLAMLAVAEETAMLDGANAELEEEMREVERLTALTQKNAVASETLDTRKTQETVARGRIQMMEAMVAERQIKAPFAGVVGLRRISPGALVEPGTVITTLDKIDTMKLDFTVPEVFLGTLKKGVKIQAKSPAFPDRAFDGEISTVDSRVDSVTRSVAVRARIPNDDRLLRPGMLLTVVLERNAREAIAVPERAIVPVRNSQAVYRIKDGNMVEKVEVGLGRRVPGYVEILSGLEEGDRIVTDGILTLSDGAAVEVKGEFDKPVEGFDPTNSTQISE